MGYGQGAGGTLPTGMHSCSAIITLQLIGIVDMKDYTENISLISLNNIGIILLAIDVN